MPDIDREELAGDMYTEYAYRRRADGFDCCTWEEIREHRPKLHAAWLAAADIAILALPQLVKATR